MEERLRYGISINNLWLSELGITTNHSTLEAQEEQETCKSGVPILDGGNYSSMKEEALLTSKMQELLMWEIAKTLKDKQLMFKREMGKTIRDGQLYILTKSQLISPRVFIQTSIFTATGHSI